MWKKVLLVCIGFVGVFSIVYLEINDSLLGVLKANVPVVYDLGGDVTGRVNKAPNNLIGTTGIGTQKGDKIYMGEVYLGGNLQTDQNHQPIGWQMITNDMEMGVVNGTDAWLALATLPIAKIGAIEQANKAYYIYSDLLTKTLVTTKTGVANFEDSNLNVAMNAFNQQWTNATNNLIYQEMIATNISDRFDTLLKQFQTDYTISNQHVYTQIKEYVRTGFFGKQSFLMHRYHYASQNVQDFGVVKSSFRVSGNKDYTFYFEGASSNDSLIYHTHDIYQDGSKNGATFAINGATGALSFQADTFNEPYYIRPSIFIENDSIVFSVSELTSSKQPALVTQPIVPTGYTSIAKDAQGKHMKARVYNSQMQAQIDPILRLSNNNEIAKYNNRYQIVEGNSINISAKGNTIIPNSSLSLLIFDGNGVFIGYQPLGTASDTFDTYTIDLSDLEPSLKPYQIGVVNEVFDATSVDPAYSSLISDVVFLEITPKLNVNVDKKTSLDFGLNVNQGDEVASISTSSIVNGVNYPTTGAQEILYSVVSDTTLPAHTNDYKRFDIGINASNQPIVIVKDTNGLDAGDYYFKVKGIDANNEPSNGIDSTTVHIVVEPATTSITFDTASTTKKSITVAGTNWTEKATSTPSNSELKVTYSKTGGDIGLIDIDPDTGEITYKGSNAYGKVTIRATVDDASSTGKDNYTSSYAEKDIVIYREVDGSVTPDSASSDSNIPTFSASDTNVKTNGVIGTITGSKGTPDTIDGSTTTYTYGLKAVDDYSLFHVDPATGVITTKANLGVDSYSITVTVSDKWSTKEMPVTINVGVAQAEALKFYENSSSNTIITTKSVSLTESGVTVFAIVKGSTNTNPVTYKIKDNSTNVITINATSGVITIKGVGTVTIVAEKDGASGQAKATAELQFTVTAGVQNFIYTDHAGNELSKSGDKYNAYTETYDVNKKFQLYTSGSPSGATITYTLKDPDSTLQDVISVDPNTGEVTILNASLPAQLGKIVVVATSHDPTGNYADASIELPITINKGTRTVAFADHPINVISGAGSVTPVVTVDGVIDTSTTYSVEVDASEDSSIAWTSGRTTIDYDYSDASGKDIKINITKNADRNYVVANGTGILHIMGANESALTTTSPGKVVYGKKFSIESTQDDSLSANVQYTFTVNDTTYISNPTVTGNKAEFDALKFSGNTETEITITRTADGELPLTKKIKVKVLPKEITIQIDDQTKLKGEPNPAFTYQDFSSQLVSWNGVQDVIQTSDIKLSTTAKETSAVGGYPITGDATYLNKTYPNYSFTFTNGTLTITEENIEDGWYHLELDDGKNTVYGGTWTNQDVNIISDHSDYVNISKDQSTWTPNKVTVSTEGKIEQSFWMKKDSGAITSEKKETILIDKTAPVIKTITATDTNNKLQDIINKLSGGIFFQPGTAFEITTSDEKDELKTSGTASIDYKIYKQNEDKTYGSPMKQDTLTVTNEKAKVTISDTTGTYKICVLPKDHAGNVAKTETCKELTLKKLNVDIDGDGKDDFNDIDGNGCADFNIIYTDEKDGKQKVLNVDADRDGIPEMNIDSDGDGRPDINVDTDGDGKPDLNLLIMTKELSQGTPSVWKPTTCVTQHGEEYASGVDLTPVINVDLDFKDVKEIKDAIPDINIDNNGDMKPDFNISTDGKKAHTNIYIFHEWKPKHDYTSNGFVYDSIGTDPDEPKRELNIDTDGDGLPDVNIDLDDDGKADINIDLNGDEIPDIDIDTTGNGKADTNVDTNGDGKPDENIVEIKEWKPEHDNDVNGMKYDTMRNLGKKDQLEDQGIVVVKPDGEAFDPSYTLEVENITDHTSNVTVNDIKKYAGGQEIKHIYEVSLLKSSIRVQPNGALKIKIPYDATIKSPKLIVEQSDGTYKVIEPDIEEGYLVYEASYLGKVAVIGDGETAITPKDPDTDIGGGDDNQGTSVKGTYTSIGNQVGGASTGDTTHIAILMFLGITSLLILVGIFRKVTH